MAETSYYIQTAHLYDRDAKPWANAKDNAELLRSMKHSIEESAPISSQCIVQQLNAFEFVNESLPRDGHLFFEAFAVSLDSAPADAATLLRIAYGTKAATDA